LLVADKKSVFDNFLAEKDSRIFHFQKKPLKQYSPNFTVLSQSF